MLGPSVLHWVTAGELEYFQRLTCVVQILRAVGDVSGIRVLDSDLSGSARIRGRLVAGGDVLQYTSHFWAPSIAPCSCQCTLMSRVSVH